MYANLGVVWANVGGGGTGGCFWWWVRWLLVNLTFLMVFGTLGKENERTHYVFNTFPHHRKLRKRVIEKSIVFY